MKLIDYLRNVDSVAEQVRDILLCVFHGPVGVSVDEDFLEAFVHDPPHQGAVVSSHRLNSLHVNLVVFVGPGEVEASIPLLVDQQVREVDLKKASLYTPGNLFSVNPAHSLKSKGRKATQFNDVTGLLPSDGLPVAGIFNFEINSRTRKLKPQENNSKLKQKAQDFGKIGKKTTYKNCPNKEENTLQLL